MKNLTTKISCLFFLLLWLIPMLAVISFDIKQQLIRHRMEEKLEFESLQTVNVPEKEVIWMDDHEIWVNDHMFDIHSKELNNGIYTFTGLYDEEETNLVLNQHKNAEKDQQQSRLLTQLFKCLQSIFYQTNGTGDEALVERRSYTNLRPPLTLNGYIFFPIQPPKHLRC